MRYNYRTKNKYGYTVRVCDLDACDRVWRSLAARGRLSEAIRAITAAYHCERIKQNNSDIIDRAISTRGSQRFKNLICDTFNLKNYDSPVTDLVFVDEQNNYYLHNAQYTKKEIDNVLDEMQRDIDHAIDQYLTKKDIITVDETISASSSARMDAAGNYVNDNNIISVKDILHQTGLYDYFTPSEIKKYILEHSKYKKILKLKKFC